MAIRVESSQTIATEVINAAQNRPPGLNPKLAQPFGRIADSQQLQIRAIDLMRKIGELTTPTTVNLARLSASWATRRYFWAVDDPVFPTPPFRLSQDARSMERHQKTLLSDEFGVGFAGLLVERLLGTNRFVDMEFALVNPQRYFGVQHVGPRWPDYLFWGPSTPVYIVECKGSQTNWSGVINQLRRGMEQLPSIIIPGYPTEQIVVATYLDDNSTRVIFLDPPVNNDDETQSRKGEKPSESTPLEIEPRRWQVRDSKAFLERLNIGTNITLLRWVAQHAKARELESRLEVDTKQIYWPDATLEPVETKVGDFLGVSIAFAPEIGLGGPSIFRGLRRDILTHLENGDLEETLAPNNLRVDSKDPLISIGSSGTCLMLRNLDL
jgi:hypothetical protein